jgi:hypothetical protein
MIEIKNDNINILLEVEAASPIHVGTAAEQHWQNGLDFISKNGKTYVLNFEKLKNKVSVNNLTSYLLNNNKEALKAEIGEDLEAISYKIFDAKVNDSEIRRFIFNALTAQPVLPGSSLKGAIRSILLTHFYKTTGGNYNENALIGGFENSVMRFFQLSDTAFESSIVANSKVFNLQTNNEGGWKNGGFTNEYFDVSKFNTQYECLSPSSKGHSTLSFKKTSSNLLLEEGVKNDKIKTPPRNTHEFLKHFEFKTLFGIINQHTLSYLAKEIAFYEKYAFDTASNAVLDALISLKEQAEHLDDSQACMLRMSAGSGFHSITGDWQESDFINTGIHKGGRNNGKQKYKSRKVAFYDTDRGTKYEPMGFVILRQTSKEAQAAAQQQAEAAAIEAAAIEAAQAEAERIAAKEAKKPKMYDGTISKGLEVDAEVIYSKKPNKVKIYVKGYEDKLFDMIESAQQPKGYICRVSLVVLKGRILRVIHKKPK